ncbi:MAG: glycosyltransferase family 4 protein [Caldilineaceae bacterium]|nr:glycosyltransferase family 4 protein [Caldilineaceae bacterium]
MKIAVYHNLPAGGGKRALHAMVARLAQHHVIDGYALATADHHFCDIRPSCQRHIVFPFRPLPLAQPPLGRLNQGIRSAELLRLMRVQRQIAAQIDRAAYDLVFVHNCRIGQSPSLLRFLRTPTLFYCQEVPRQVCEPAPARPSARFSRGQRLGNLFDPLPRLYAMTLTQLDRGNVQAAGAVLANSAYSRETFFQHYGVMADICYLGIDSEYFQATDEPREAYVLSVGALHPRKGFDLLIDSLALIEPARRPPLLIVSNAVDEVEKAYLRALAQRQHVAVTFRAHIADDEMVTLYNRALMTVYTPLMEPFGFVALEAMSTATPIVGVNEGGVRESIVPGQTGLLVERKPRAVAEAIRTLLDDAPLRRRLGQEGRAHVLRNWQWSSCIARLERAMQELLGATRSGA